MPTALAPAFSAITRVSFQRKVRGCSRVLSSFTQISPVKLISGDRNRGRDRRPIRQPRMEPEIGPGAPGATPAGRSRTRPSTAETAAAGRGFRSARRAPAGCVCTPRAVRCRRRRSRRLHRPARSECGTLACRSVCVLCAPDGGGRIAVQPALENQAGLAAGVLLKIERSFIRVFHDVRLHKRFL